MLDGIAVDAHLDGAAFERAAGKTSRVKACAHSVRRERGVERLELDGVRRAGAGAGAEGREERVERLEDGTSRNGRRRSSEG